MWLEIQNCSLKSTHRNHIPNHINTNSKSYQNCIKITFLKPYQNHIKITKTCEKSTKHLSRGCFCFLFLKPTHRNHIKTVSKSYQNCMKIISKPYQHHIKTIAKSNENHKNPREIDQKAVPGLFLFPFLTPTRREP
jgi:hypothetical protein